MVAPVEVFVMEELGSCRPWEDGAVCPPRLDVVVEGYSLSVPAVALPDIALLKLPVGAPNDPRF